MRTLLLPLLAGGLLLVSACEEGDSTAPNTPGPNFVTQLGCEQHPELCGGGFPGDEDEAAPGIFMGSAVSPTLCFSLTGASINDVDHDGLADHCEDALAEAFRPELVYSPYDCNMGMEPYWAAKYFPVAEGVDRVRIAYLFAYYEDCGIPSQYALYCTIGEFMGTYLTYGGILDDKYAGIFWTANEPKCDGHFGDSEFVTIDLMYDTSTHHWRTVSMFFSAHWNTSGDKSRNVLASELEFPGPVPGGYPNVWVSAGKHANYPTRAVCENDGQIADYCDGNYLRMRIRASPQYNVGSAQKNLINTGTCVSGGTLIQYYPELYRTECFWGNSGFNGWNADVSGTIPTGYRTELVWSFECYSMRFRAFGYTCTNWGVDTGA